MVNNLPAMRETQVPSLGQEDPQQKEMATHSSIFAWRIPRTEEPDRLQSMGSQRVRHSWACTHAQGCQCVHDSVLPPLRGTLDSIMHFLNSLGYESSVWQAVFNYSKLQLAPLAYLSVSLLSNVPASSCPWARTCYQTRHKVLALMQAWFPQDVAYFIGLK